MIIKYGLPNEAKTDITKWETVGICKQLIMPDGSKVQNPQVEHFEAAGWLLWVDPVCDYAIEKLGGYLLTDTVTQDKIALTVEEISVKAATHLNTLLAKLSEEANRRVDLIITPSEKPHWMGVADAISRKHALWSSDQLEAVPNPVTYPPLTIEEHQTWFSLSLVQTSTAEVRGVAMTIAADLNQKTSAEILLITLDDIVSHVLWP